MPLLHPVTRTIGLIRHLLVEGAFLMRMLGPSKGGNYLRGRRSSSAPEDAEARAASAGVLPWSSSLTAEARLLAAGQMRFLSYGREPAAGEALVRIGAAAITRDELTWPVDRLPATPSYGFPASSPGWRPTCTTSRSATRCSRSHRSIATASRPSTPSSRQRCLRRSPGA